MPEKALEIKVKYCTRCVFAGRDKPEIISHTFNFGNILQITTKKKGETNITIPSFLLQQNNASRKV